MVSKNKKEETATVQAALQPEALDAAASAAPAAPVAAETEPSVTVDKGKEVKRQKPAAKSAASVLENVGKAAIARHGFAEVYVTSDGLAFRLRSDAQHHAADLACKDIIKVTRK